MRPAGEGQRQFPHSNCCGIAFTLTTPELTPHWTVCRLPGSDRQSLTLRAGYAARRISSNLNGRTSKFGWLQARATIQIMQKLRTWRAIRFRPVVHTEVHNSDV
jgi:hypothetical protein